MSKLVAIHFLIYLYTCEEYFQVAKNIIGGTDLLPLEKVDTY